MKRFMIFITTLLMLILGCAPQQPKSLFDYDPSVPFDVIINSQIDRDGVTVSDLSYASYDPNFSPSMLGRTVAYLVTPQGEGPFAGVIFMHWLGNVDNSRGQYLGEAVELAKHGVICLLPQGYYPWMAFPTLDKSDRPLIIGQVIEMRRAIDFLLTQSGIEPDWLGFVGHDYGALYGGVLSGADRRMKTYVLIAGAPSFADVGPYWNYTSVVPDLDPVQYVSKASPASIFFQFARRDQFISGEMANRLYQAASEPKEIKWYDDNHQIVNKSASQDRMAWLTEKLNLK
jgi:dienelactone hydrolase